MLYRNVQQRNARFVWRLNLLGEVIRNLSPEDKELSYATPQRAAYECDLFKHYVRERYGFKSPKTLPSLPEDNFRERAAAAGLDLSNLDAVYNALPWRAREFCKDAGPLLQEQSKTLAPEPTDDSAYFRTLIVALPKRLSEARALVAKTKQLKDLSQDQKEALDRIDLIISTAELEVEANSRDLLPT